MENNNNQYIINKEKIIADINYIKNKLVSPSKNIVCMQLSEELGILPHQLPNGSLIFVDKQAEYKKGDYIVITDTRLGSPTSRIIKATQVPDKDFLGKVLFQIQKFD